MLLTITAAGTAEARQCSAGQHFSPLAERASLRTYFTSARRRFSPEDSKQQLRQRSVRAYEAEQKVSFSAGILPELGQPVFVSCRHI